jgi:hypothetical protein
MMRDIRLQLVMVCVCGCGPVTPGDAETGSESTAGGSSSSSSGVVPSTSEGAPSGGGTTGIVSGGTSSGGGNEVSSAVDTGDDGTFIVDSDLPGDWCDIWGQDCPAGQKCAPYADDGGGSWNSTKCVDVADDPKQVDEPCVAEGNGVSGIDDCDVGLFCWDVDEQNVGRCIGLCNGTPDAPTCPDGTFCEISRSGTINLCLTACDPLADSPCLEDEVCIPNGDAFLCVLDASGEEGQVHDPCEFANACDPGLYCISAQHAVECDQANTGCCQPFCDLTQMNTCAGEGQTCVGWFEEGVAPEGYEKLGICAIAQ